ncbi:MAG TPA: ParB N-terminal domain-containing protein [Pirellulales bacterium]|nr:ParB N-terminal domain-containing protein [Pirellulales bacterium]
MNAQVMEVRCSEIKIGDRHRKDMGDLQALATSIEEVGLLQPIGIRESNELVFGARRLRAVKEILGLPTIAARVVSVPSILQGECDENVIRKDFTVSERVGIAAALKEEIKAKIGERRGRPLEDAVKQEDFPELEGRQTRDVVAERAGFGNPKTYEQAEQVVKKGHADLVKAMDDGAVSISAAAKLANLPKPKQKRAVASRREAARQLNRGRKRRGFSVEEALARLVKTVRNAVEKFHENDRHKAVARLRELANEFERMIPPEPAQATEAEATDDA